MTKRSDRRFRCIDCATDTLASGEYYMVRDDLWAAAGMAPHGGMLCSPCLEHRIGRWLVDADFTAKMPSLRAWQHHLAARVAARLIDPRQLDLFAVTMSAT